MQKSPFQPCIPTRAAKVPDRPDWIHEIKHDGYRLIVQRLGNWTAVHMRRPGGIREAKDALTRCAVMGFDLDAMDLAFINGQIRQN
jgi:hypothetical protein